MTVNDTRIEVGDTVFGYTVVEVVRATSAAGVVTFTTPNMSATVRRGTGAPIATSGDSLFSAFVLSDGGGNYLLGVHHPKLGLRVQPSAPATTCNETFDMCWKLGVITIQEDGVAVVGARASIRIIRTTADGDVEYAVGSNMFHTLDPVTHERSGYSGKWLTIAGGELRCNQVADESARLIWLPRYPGNTMGTDLPAAKCWDGNATRESTEYMTEMRVWYKGISTVVYEDTNATLNLTTGTLLVTGNPGSQVQVALEGGSFDDLPVIKTATVGGGGTVSIGGLSPGRYAVWQYDTPGVGYVDHASVGARVWATVTRGATTNVTAPALESAAPGNALCYAYEYGAEPWVGPLYYWAGSWVLWGNTDANGRLEATQPPPAGAGDPAWIAINSSAYGHHEWHTINGVNFQLCAGAKIMHPYLVRSMGLGALTITESSWFDDTTGDENIPARADWSYYVTDTGGASGITLGFEWDNLGNWLTTDAVPRSAAESVDRFTWGLYRTADDVLVATLGTLANDPFMDTSDGPGYPGEQVCVTGRSFAGAVSGGKVNGNVTHYGTSSAQIGTD